MEEAKAAKTKKPAKKRVNVRLFGLAMFLLGAFVVVAIRFATIKNDDVHYHANFALYVSGQQDQFKNFTFYEEVAACTVHDPDDMKSRAHMHGETPGLVHVHAHAVTWGQFFANLGYTLGNKVLVTDAGVYADGTDGNHLTFLLNNQPVQTVEDRVIKSEDVLLIDYGKDDAATQQAHSAAIPRTAHKANTTADPATCSGNEPLTFTNRLKQSLGLHAPRH
jgi:hypothetical protein